MINPSTGTLPEVTFLSHGAMLARYMWSCVRLFYTVGLHDITLLQKPATTPVVISSHQRQELTENRQGTCSVARSLCNRAGALCFPCDKYLTCHAIGQLQHERHSNSRYTWVYQGCREDGISIPIPTPYPYPWGSPRGSLYPRQTWSISYRARFSLRTPAGEWR